MEVLFVAAEAYPFIKVGGLGDVALGLPKALKAKGVNIRIIMPKYKFPKKYRKQIKSLAKYNTFIGWKTVACTLGYCKHNDMDYYFIDNSKYFYRENVYGYGDDDERFIFFSKAVLEGIKYMHFVPDIIHCNDWHSAMVVTLKDIYYKEYEYKNIKTLFTIHNLAYQGQFGKDILWMLGIDEKKYYVEKEFKHYEGVNFMKWAINKANMVTTVSPNYAEEVTESYLGFGLDGVIKNRGENFKGILNGIDYDTFKLPVQYDIEKIIQYKKVNKIELQERLKLNIGEDIPVISMISRLTNQKGIGLLISNIQEFINRGLEIIICGTGESIYEYAIKELEKKYEGKVKALTTFNENMANRIYISSDMFLIPSIFEPCGLTQMISMRFGTIPIVREVGGLKDSVKEFNEITCKGNGFSFKEYDGRAMMDCVDRALNIFYTEKWKRVIENAINSDNSWSKRAKEYKEIYAKLKKTKL